MAADTQVLDFPIVGYYDRQRFRQYNPSDCANFLLIPNDLGKKKVAMYPALGRKHVFFQGFNQLQFPVEPRDVFKSVNFWYAISGDRIYRIDKNFNQFDITASTPYFNKTAGDVYFAYLVVGTLTFCGFTDGEALYVYQEPDTTQSGTFTKVTDPLCPANPTFIATFGNRFVVSGLNSSIFNLSEINMMGASYNSTMCFHVAGANSLFASEIGPIRQMAVVQNTLFIFTDYKTGIWSNYPSTFLSYQSSGQIVVDFPWKKNTSVEWDYGMADPKSMDQQFNMIVWVAQNSGGIDQVMKSVGGAAPERISTKAIDVLFQRTDNNNQISPFIDLRVSGFLYEYENTILYRLAAGVYNDSQLLDLTSHANAIEFNFDAEQWSRAIESNGARSRVQRHVYFDNRHLVTVQGDSTIYEFSGQFYQNEHRNPAQPNGHANDAYIADPMRYEKITPNITIKNMNQIGYAEFITDSVCIDFVFGETPYLNVDAPFKNAQFIILETPATDGDPVYITSENAQQQFLIAENSNTPTESDTTYFNWLKPHVSLYYSDDGGITYTYADDLEFSPMGMYEWQMRWYSLGTSRNRVYKLVCVSSFPIVVLGGCMFVRRASGGTE